MNSAQGLTAMAVLAGIWLTPTTAPAYRQTMTCTESGPYACEPHEQARPVHWTHRCVTYRINDQGSAHTDAEDGLSEPIVDAITWSFDQWSKVTCSDLYLQYDGPTPNAAAEFNAGQNAANINLVVFRDRDWQSVASSETFALTSVTYNPNTGVVSDADIEINSALYPLSVVEPVEADKVDLRNALVHEVGHFIGLDHVRDPAATMYANADVGETNKRSLSPDDREGICEIYPADDGASQSCEQAPARSGQPNPDSGCCATADAPAPLSTGWLVSIVGLLGLCAMRRRCRG